MVVDNKTYLNDKNNFFKKHNYDFICETSSMDKYGNYSKTYSFADNSKWFELMSIEYCKEVVEVKKCKMEIEVKMFRTEFFNTDSGYSKIYYEKF